MPDKIILAGALLGSLEKLALQNGTDPVTELRRSIAMRVYLNEKISAQGKIQVVQKNGKVVPVEYK